MSNMDTYPPGLYYVNTHTDIHCQHTREESALYSRIQKCFKIQYMILTFSSKDKILIYASQLEFSISLCT